MTEFLKSYDVYIAAAFATACLWIVLWWIVGESR